MSRIGKLPIKMPAGVKIAVKGQDVEVTGPKGTLKRTISDEIGVEVNDGSILLKPVIENENTKAMWGLTRVLIDNMVNGVVNGYRKDLEVVGVGYKFEMKGQDVNVAAGLSKTVLYKAPVGIKLAVEGQVKLSIEGIDKESVGQVAADIRRIRPPEPYKGKGIRYSGEAIRRKAGKTAGK